MKDLLITGISQLVTAEGAGPKRGAAMRELKIVERAALAVSSGVIAWVGKAIEWTGDAATTVDVGGRAVVPGMVDPHTHAVWAGDRLADFEARSSGVSYESILTAGGGIRSTIRATAAASKDVLVALARPRIEALIASGATTIEVKSGYGFTPAAEIRMLEAIEELAAIVPARIVPTLLIHIPPKDQAERAAYLTQICEELIPEVASRKLAAAVDVFVEREAWQPSEAELMLRAAVQHRLAVKLHSDQFQAIGGVELAIRSGALSVDHLEASGAQEIAQLAASSTIATILPGVSLHLGTPAAAGRELIDAGAAVAVGTDLNPGSSPLFSVAAAMALAVRLNGLTEQEALVATTANAACALGIRDVGRVETGCRADFVVLQGSDWRDVAYMLGANPVREVWIGGRRVMP
ncbi:MAG TPA: imidazolonepropionase [Acidobacteriaceae bacterium]|nr:imidazolonepropionase [Acidobacteriaceae bacterium]